MDTSKHIAITKVGEHITVRVLNMNYDAVLKCDRECSYLDEARDGSIFCRMKIVSKMVNFRTKALLIDYEVILDKKSPNDMFVNDSDFRIVDNDGHVHNGKNLCNKMVDIEKGVDGFGDMIYPGTRSLFRVYYESFPVGQKVTSLIIDMSNMDAVRINFSPNVSLQDYQEDQPEPGVIPVPHDIYERLEKLEKEVEHLRKIYQADSSRPMSDPGIGYHPLDNK